MASKLQPNSKGLQPTSKGLQPTNKGLQPYIAMAIQPNSKRPFNLQAKASNLHSNFLQPTRTKASNLQAKASNLQAKAFNLHSKGLQPTSKGIHTYKLVGLQAIAITLEAIQPIKLEAIQPTSWRHPTYKQRPPTYKLLSLQTMAIKQRPHDRSSWRPPWLLSWRPPYLQAWRPWPLGWRPSLLGCRTLQTRPPGLIAMRQPDHKQ